MTSGRLLFHASLSHVFLDPLLTCLLKDTHILNAPILLLAEVVNRSLTTGCMPQIIKTAVVTPLSKKRRLDVEIMKNYRLVSNLTFVGRKTGGEGGVKAADKLRDQ